MEHSQNSGGSSSIDSGSSNIIDKYRAQKQTEQSGFSIKGSARSADEISQRREKLIKMISKAHESTKIRILNAVLHELDWILYERENPSRWDVDTH